MEDQGGHDYSGLAPEFDDDVLELEDSGFHSLAQSEEALLGDDFEAEMELMAQEEIALSVTDEDVERQMAQLRRAIEHLSESLVDAELDAEEAMLNAMLLEDEEL